jgi:putative transposase
MGRPHHSDNLQVSTLLMFTRHRRNVPRRSSVWYMPWGLKRFQQANCLHFITFSCHHREPLLGTPRARDVFGQTLEQVRRWYDFYVCGYVVMPEHVHLLMSEPERGQLSLALQMLKQNVARELRLPEGSPFWQPRYYDFNVWSEAKRVEKLRYIHRNPVRRRLVQRPDDWRWSSFLHYATGVEGVVEIESQWTARRRERMGIVPTVRQNQSQSQNPRPVSPKDGETRTGHPRN